MKNLLSKVFIEYLNEIQFEDKKIIEILKTKDSQFGDYTTNIAFKLSKFLQQKPLEIAKEIRKFILKNNNKKFKKVTVTEPGFVNLFLSNNYIVQNSMKFLDAKYKPEFSHLKKLKINYEYVSANPTGDLHIGHARNAIVGLVVVNVLKYIGHEVFTEYYINDGGNQMKVLAESVYFYYAKFMNIKSNLKKEDIGYHGPEIADFAKFLIAEKIVIEGKNEKEKINGLTKISGEHFLSTIKKMLLNLDLPKFDKWTSESQLLEEETSRIFDILKDKDNLYFKDGATWIKVQQFGDVKDRVLVKNDGTFTYMFADLANHVNKYNRGFDLMIDLWGKDHHGYEPRIQASLKSLGMGGKLQVDYISMVQIIENNEVVKMSKRAGTSLRIKDILNKMNKDILKYFLISKAKEQEMEIDVDMANQKDLSNPFFYIQYSNARINQLLNRYKNEVDEIKLLNSFSKLGNEEKEIELLKKMIEFEDVIISINNEREPSLLINYFRELAQVFNSYYSLHSIISSDKKLSKERINLIYALNNQFKTIFNLLGIKPINKI
ncbi:MAG: arginine--tRNA ligase [Candidatus Tyloplasma litorale]|nr:MAG: arginine--tRNA ligase [Mycoplasmatales bacterium]